MVSNKRKIAVFTGTRAEYGLLSSLLKLIKKSEETELLLYVGGTHLSTSHGYTIERIIEDGFTITETLDFLLGSDTAVGVAKSLGLATMAAAEAMSRTTPDLIVVLGDRYEVLGVAQAAMIACIPIAHIHGGERTEGLIDEAIRHAVTKMSHLHFTATNEYKKRVEQLGEDPSRVFNVGAPGIDVIHNICLLDRQELTKSLGLCITDSPFAVVTYHPVTLEKDGGINELESMLDCLVELDDFKFIITLPNSDMHNKKLVSLLNTFVQNNIDRVLLTESLGQLRYLSAVKHCEFGIGNSSSGLIEVPTFNVPTINIGDRQRGRVAGTTVIQCEGTYEDIKKSIERARSLEFKRICREAQNPYGNGGSSEKIFSVLRDYPLTNLLNKSFVDLDG